MSLCIIAPRLPPAFDGIGDYTWMLWRNWTDENIPGLDAAQPLQRENWSFLVADGAEESRAHLPGISIEELPRDEAKLVNLLDSRQVTKLLVQYVGYGFDIHGSPDWLTSAISRWRHGDASRRLLIMFHESWPHPRVWQRTFWRVKHQIRCARQLILAADVAVTSNSATRQDLIGVSDGMEVELIPIGSSFKLKPAEDTDYSVACIFGREATRLRALDLHKELLRRIDEAQILRSIVVAGERKGPGTEKAEEIIRRLELKTQVEYFYDFAPDAVPVDLQRAGLALMHTESKYLLKSTSYNLAAMLGQVPVTVEAGDPGSGLVRNKHYVSYDSSDFDELVQQLRDTDQLRQIRTNVLDLAEHQLSWHSIVQRWFELLNRS